MILIEGLAPKTSLSNHLPGVVSRLHEGPVSTEVVVDLALTRVRHVTAVVTTQSVASLGLKEGSPVTAAFQASSVVLAALG